MNYIYDEETNLIMQHNRKKKQVDLPAKVFRCKHQNPTLASKWNKGKKDLMEGYSSQNWREGWGRLGVRELPGALMGHFSLLWLGSISFLSVCPVVPDSDSSKRQSDWPNLGSYTHSLAHWQPLVEPLEMGVGSYPKETWDAVTKEGGRDARQAKPSHPLHGFTVNRISYLRR